MTDTLDLLKVFKEEEDLFHISVLLIINLQQPLHIQVVLVYGTLLMGQLLWHVNVVNRLDQC